MRYRQIKIKQACQHIYIVCLIILCCLNNESIFAQRYPFYNLNVEQGLIQSQVATLLQDRFGELWIGTLGGISRYDGKSFVNYTVRNGMLNNTVRDITEDQKGIIWIGGANGVCSYNGKSFKNYVLNASEGGVSNVVEEIKADRQNNIWCRGAGKLYRITNNKVVAFTVPGDPYISSILSDTNKLLIACRNGKIYTYSNQGKWDSLAITNTVNDYPPYVVRMYQDRSKRVWIGTSKGLYRIDSNKVELMYVGGHATTDLPAIYSICEDNNGGLWLGTTSGAVRIFNNGIQYYSKHNGLTDNAIFDVLNDAEGNIWLASDGQGIFRFSGTQFTVLDESMGLPSAQVMAIAAKGSNKIFLGTYDAGLYTFEEGKIFPLAFPVKTPTITALTVSPDGKVWIGTRGMGLWSYGSIFKSYSYPDHHFPSNTVTTLYTDPYKRIWVGFANGALVYVHDTFKHIAINYAVTSFISISEDSVLISTSRGIKLWTGGAISDYVTKTVLDSGETECFTRLGNELWAGTADNGIVRYNLSTGKAFVINKNNGLRSDFIYNITTDNEGNIWAGTGFGIHKIKLRANGEPQVTFYGKGNGITGMESNHNAIYKMADGSIWFGTTNGALHYQPHTSTVSQQPVSIVMKDVKLFGEHIGDTSYYDSTDSWYGVPYGLRLPYQKNNISFSFEAISLSGGEQLRYRYRMEGLEAPWSVWSPTNSVTFSALPPGKYTFIAQCETGADDQKIKELHYNFEIITPFQKTGWFSLLILGGCILLGVTMQYIANHRKQNRLKLMRRLRAEEQTKIRMRTAEDFHDEVGNKLTRINVLTNVLKNKIENKTPDIDRILDQIQDNTGQLYSGTRDILWSLKPSNDSLYEILNRIRDFGMELFQDTDIEFAFTGIENKWQETKLPMDVSRNLIMIFKEALNNILKHGVARHVALQVTMKKRDVLQLVLTDDGKGFDIRTVKKGHGIDNMNVRAARIHGKLYIDSAEAKGTIINLSFRLPEKK
ncbi:MAG: hypothetical protein H0X33_11555 [Taibaiella sp.]|nr:hypothetical protein [Taibaiella sp.]